jgi:hypothetical protein
MDWDLWCRLSLKGAEFKYISELLAAVRYYPETKTLSGKKRRYKEIYRIERKYGRRVLPVSCFGAYRWGLTFKKNKTRMERLFFLLLDILRFLKRRVYNTHDPTTDTEETRYGFHRWEPIVEGRCTIHLPWYDKRQWTKLYLKVDPVDNEFRIKINDQIPKHSFSEGGHLVAEVQPLVKPYRKISIESLDKVRWRLLEFRCDLMRR